MPGRKCLCDVKEQLCKCSQVFFMSRPEHTFCAQHAMKAKALYMQIFATCLLQLPLRVFFSGIKIMSYTVVFIRSCIRMRCGSLQSWENGASSMVKQEQLFSVLCTHNSVCCVQTFT